VILAFVCLLLTVVTEAAVDEVCDDPTEDVEFNKDVVTTDCEVDMDVVVLVVVVLVLVEVVVCINHNHI
jgi:hypothetical protein